MVKVKTFFFIVLTMILIGCSPKTSPEIQYVKTPVYVNVPVIDRPKIKPIVKPNLEIKKLNDNSTPSEVAEAYYNSLQQMIKYSKLLEKALLPFYEEYLNGARNTK